jgi:hypothetical protein
MANNTPVEVQPHGIEPRAAQRGQQRPQARAVEHAEVVELGRDEDTQDSIVRTSSSPRGGHGRPRRRTRSPPRAPAARSAPAVAAASARRGGRTGGRRAVAGGDAGGCEMRPAEMVGVDTTVVHPLSSAATENFDSLMKNSD